MTMVADSYAVLFLKSVWFKVAEEELRYRPDPFLRAVLFKNWRFSPKNSEEPSRPMIPLSWIELLAIIYGLIPNLTY